MTIFASLGSGAEATPFTRAEVRDRIRAAGAAVSEAEVKESFERLTLAYVLRLEDGRYDYPVPLLRAYVLAECEDRPEEALAEAVSEWRAERGLNRSDPA